MSNFWVKFSIVTLLAFCVADDTSAHTTTLALTGSAAPGVPSATWDQLEAVTLNNLGSVAFAGSLQHSGSVNATNDSGLWLFDGDGEHLLAQTGSGGVAEVAGADFAEFDRPLLSDDEVIVSALMSAGIGGVTVNDDEGVWRFGSATASLEFRSGSGGVPGMPTADFARVPRFLGTTNMEVAGNGDFAFFNDMQFGVGGVLSTNNRGLWSYPTGSGSTLLAREGVQGVPGLSNASFTTFTTPRINSSGLVAVRAIMKTGGTINSSNANGVWLYDGAVGELVARTGVGSVPGYQGESYATLGWPRLNEVGQVAIAASLDDSTNSQGIWIYDEGAGALVASPDSVVPGVANAVFAELTLNAINDAGQILAMAVLEDGTGGVSNDDRHGLWILNQDENLVARSGVGNVPGVPGASFASFTNATLNELGQVAFVADLQLGGSVDDSSDSGLWIVEPTGASRLVAREGDQLAGRTIDSLSFLSDEDEDRGAGFNDIGELAFQASFTNGESGLFLFRPYAADFDRDGRVDSNDLGVWHSSFASSSAADADLDDDSDGADFLVWQRENGSGNEAVPILSQVPEPASLALCVFAAIGGMSLPWRNWHTR